MKNAWRLFKGDMKRLGANAVTIVVVLGLVALPSLFAWFNVLACWDVFGNTGKLAVAVANSDEGYESDLVPLRINVGEQVVSALRANDQMDWVFTDEDDAVDGAKAGRYYAAVVIPSDFSRDMMTFYSDDAQRAEIRYYANEKKNAIAPKVTEQGADQVSAQVNRVFAETLSEIALGISSSVGTYLDSADAGGAIAKLGNRIGSAGEQMTRSASIVRSYSAVLGTAQALIDDSGSLIVQARGAAGDAASSAGGAKDAVGSVADVMNEVASELSTAISQSAQGYESVAASLEEAFSSADGLAAASAESLRSQAASADSRIEGYRELATQLEALRPDVPEEALPALDAILARLGSSIELQERLRDALSAAADSVEAKSADAQDKREAAHDLAQQASESLGGVRADYDEGLKPALSQLAGNVGEAGDMLFGVTSLFDAAASDLSGTADSASFKLAEAQGALDAAANELEASGEKLSDLSRGIDDALASGDSAALHAVLGSDPAALASALSAPVQLDRHAVYPVDNFGSAMAPLYTTLALWIGALLTMVALKVNPSRRVVEGLDNPTPRQLFMGRFGVVAVISLMQSTCLCLGTMLFLGVQVCHPVLYLLCFWVSGLVFSFIVYALVASFANFGKALSVFLLIVQVSGGGGSYPLPLLPEFVQAASPYLPITHAVNAMRAAMFGVYNNDFWMEMGALALFALPFVLLGLVLRNPLIKVVSAFVEKVESTKVM